MKQPQRATTAPLIQALALALAGAVLTACTPTEQPTVVPNVEPAPPYSGVQLPNGARLDKPGIPPDDTAEDNSEWEGSLRPDNATPEERIPEILARGRIVVGVDQSQYLLSYRDVTDGDLRGFEVDLAREISRDIFGDPNRVDFRFVESQSRLQSLNNGDVDIVIRTMSITTERATKVDFSIPYLNSDVRLLAPKDRGISDEEDLPGKTLCVVDGTNLLQMARGIAPESRILRTLTWADCLMAVQQFQADAVLAEDAILAGMVAQDPYTSILQGSYGTQQYAVGIPNGEEGMTRQVNETLERLRDDGTWTALYDRWLAGSLASPYPPERSYRNEKAARGDQQ